MRLHFALLALALLAACKKEQPAPVAPPPPTVKAAMVPTEVKVPGALKAITCGGVTALFKGEAERANPTPLDVERLTFKLADGRELPFRPRGQTFPGDLTFEVFSPDCAWALLPSDHYGPYDLVPVQTLAVYLAGQPVAAPVGLRVDGGPAAVHAAPRWVSKTDIEFQAACCGGVEVYRANVMNPVAATRVFAAPEAPHGIRPEDGGYVVNP